MSGQRRGALAVALALGLIQAGPAGADDCRPELDPSKPQYIVGYGSLMQSSSKRMTEPGAGINLPVLVTGFQRAWNHRGTYPTTYLGVEPAKSARMAAALYRSFLVDGKQTKRLLHTVPGVGYILKSERS